MACVWRILRDRIPQDKIPQPDKIPQDKIPQDRIPQHKKWTKSHNMKNNNILHIIVKIILLNFWTRPLISMYLSLTYTILSVHRFNLFNHSTSYYSEFTSVFVTDSQYHPFASILLPRVALFLLMVQPLSDTCFTGSTGHIYIVNDNAMSGCWQCDDKLPSCFLDWWSWEINTALLQEQSTIYDIGLLFIWQLLFTKNQFHNMATKIICRPNTY